MDTKDNGIVTQEVEKKEPMDTAMGANRKTISLLILGSFLLSLGVCVFILQFRNPLNAQQSLERDLIFAVVAIAIGAVGVYVNLLSRKSAGGIPIPQNNSSVILVALILSIVGTLLAADSLQLVRVAQLPGIALLLCATILAAIALRHFRRLTLPGKLVGIVVLLLGGIQVGILLCGTAQQWLDAPTSRLVRWERDEGMILGDLVLTVYSAEAQTIEIRDKSGTVTWSDSPAAVIWSVFNGSAARGTPYTYVFSPDKTIWAMGSDVVYHRPDTWCVIDQPGRCSEDESDEITVAPGEEKGIFMRLGVGTWIPQAFVFQDKTLDTPLGLEDLGPIGGAGMADTPENRELLAEWKVVGRVGLVYSLR